MVARAFVASARRFGELAVVALVVAVLALTGCPDDASSDDAGVPDMSMFIGCNPDMGRQTNPACPAYLPQCHPNAQICVGCIPSSQTCQPGFACSEDSYKCLPIDINAPCTRMLDCPKRYDGANSQLIQCEARTGLCRECLEDMDCVAVGGGTGHCDLTTYTCDREDGGS